MELREKRGQNKWKGNKTKVKQIGEKETNNERTIARWHTLR
jgi:hypothetical protein